MNDVAEREETKIIEAPADPARVSELVVACAIAPLTARVLVSRGIDTPEKARLFLTPSLERDWHGPALIPGIIDVADAVERCIRAGKRLLVFGDFDVDGITATTVSVRGLRALGADVVGLIPHRYEEGYALSEKAVERAMSYAPDLIMTVDCGISCDEEVESLLARGVDVAITDHHEPGEHVPRGVPLADPKCDPDCPSRELAGAGVALKLLCVLGERFGKPDLWKDYTDIASMGTIADLMLLQGENRALVADGLQRMRMAPRAGIEALCTLSNVQLSDLSSTRLSFSLIPRLNAAGRMGDATVALDLMLTDDRAQAEKLASQLNGINDERRRVELELAESVEESLATSFADEPVIVAAGEGWHEGVKGIVASRIARAYKRPAIIFSLEDGVARGSGRTYGDTNLFELASTAEDLFEKFGGHAAAIGITMPADSIDELRARLCDAAREMRVGKPAAGLNVDACVELSECTVEGFQELEMLQPFGNGCRVPLLAARNVFLENRGAVGKQGNHLRYTAADGVSQVQGIFFSVENIDELANCESACDIVFEPSVDEWQGRFTAKLMTRKILIHPPEVQSVHTQINERVEQLFKRSVEIVDTGDYAGITQVARFNTKVVGVTFENRQSLLAHLETGVELSLRRQPDNEFDSNAIAVTTLDGTQLGFLNRHLACRLAPVMDEGIVYDAAVSAVTGGPATGDENDTRHPGPLGVRDPGVVDRSYGVNIVVRRTDLDLAPVQETLEGDLRQARTEWSGLPADVLQERLVSALIGDHELHEAQAKALSELAAGRNTIAVMATGRGKSLIFHLHAARMALLHDKASVFIYPLRALVADQAYHLQERFATFGLSVVVLTGESDEEARTKAFEGLADGTVSIVLTTPEFLSIHADRFAATRRIGFVVVDEAHHVGLARAGNRPAYAGLDRTLADLGHPQVLAVTATAGTETYNAICSTLGIQASVLDPSVRENLHLDDRRDVRDRDSYVARQVASGGKCVIYVNSRDQSIKLTRTLRKRLPSIGARIAFYNAGLSKPDRAAIERAFRTGELSCIVSTSAFGEGIDIPDIEHVMLYHLPFNDIEFNQMSGRAGRDGREAYVHLLYSYGDSRINEKILAASAPEREQMVGLYKALKQEARHAAEQGQEWFSCTNGELAETATASCGAKLDESSVSCGISVFRELGFLETSGKSVARHIRMVPGPAHMELSQSVRYREGLEEIADFKEFKSWALGAQPDELLARFNRPILPNV